MSPKAMQACPECHEAKPFDEATCAACGAIELRPRAAAAGRHRRNLCIGVGYGLAWFGLLLLMDSGRNGEEGRFALVFAGVLGLLVYGLAWLWDAAYTPKQPNGMMGTAKWCLVLACATLMALELNVVVRDHVDPDWRDRYAVSYHYAC